MIHSPTMSPNQSSIDDAYFNDLSRQPNSDQTCMDSPPDRNSSTLNGDDTGISKPKRIACVICRKRKLKCDGSKPSCGTCSRLGHNCAYDEIRRKSGPKRGYVKELEARLAQVETQLRTKPKRPATNESRLPQNVPTDSNLRVPSIDSNGSVPQGTNMQGSMDGYLDNLGEGISKDRSNVPSDASLVQDMNAGFEPTVSWEMIGLGLEEPLPTQQAIDELHQIYFEHIHPSAPMLHKYRYRAAMDLAPHMRPPVCLRYVMWCLAASVSDKYHNHQEIFYRRARKYAEADEMKGVGESFITVGHTQCWVLIASYEFKSMYFPRAWMSVGKAARLALMLGLNRLDGAGLAVKQCLLPPRDWTDKEERRRTFWMAYCVDRYASIGTGWAMNIDERDIMTHLPASEEAFEKSMSQPTLALSESMSPQEIAQLSSMAGVVFMAYFFGRNLTHLHRPEPNEREDDLQGEFWKRHRRMDNALLNTALALPSHLRLPSGIRDSKVVFLNMNFHTSTICLHQAAIFKAEANGLPASLIDQSRTRCLLAAMEIATIMRLSSHLDTASMNPFIAFCLYVGTRVLVHTLKRNPGDQEIRASVEFLLNAMNILKRRNPLSESFLMQLSLELEGSGLDGLLHNPSFSDSMMKGVRTVPADFDAMKCSPLLDIRKTQEDKLNDVNRAADFLKKEMLVVFPRPADESSPQHGNSRPTQYTLQNRSLPTREQRPGQQLWGQSPSEPINLDGVMPGSGWTQNSPSVQPNCSLDKTTFDTCMSDNTSDGHKSLGHTPSTTNNSSNPSHSPPQDEDPDSTNRTASYQQTPSSSTAELLSWSPSNEMGFSSAHSTSQQQQQQQHPDDTEFIVPPSWQANSSSELPDTLTGLGSPRDANWSQMLDGVLWDDSVMGGNNMGPWIPR